MHLVAVQNIGSSGVTNPPPKITWLMSIRVWASTQFFEAELILFFDAKKVLEAVRGLFVCAPVWLRAMNRLAQ